VGTGATDAPLQVFVSRNPASFVTDDALLHSMVSLTLDRLSCTDILSRIVRDFFVESNNIQLVRHMKLRRELTSEQQRLMIEEFELLKSEWLVSMAPPKGRMGGGCYQRIIDRKFEQHIVSLCARPDKNNTKTFRSGRGRGLSSAR